MIQPIKQFRVTRLTISGFKGYADQKTFQFGGMNVISGHMGVGKSSIADAIAFAITGVGFYAGAKIDYLYHQDISRGRLTCTPLNRRSRHRSSWKLR